jgi:hypothetical protein
MGEIRLTYRDNADTGTIVGSKGNNGADSADSNLMWGIDR